MASQTKQRKQTPKFAVKKNKLKPPASSILKHSKSTKHKKKPKRKRTVKFTKAAGDPDKLVLRARALWSTRPLIRFKNPTYNRDQRTRASGKLVRMFLYNRAEFDAWVIAHEPQNAERDLYKDLVSKCVFELEQNLAEYIKEFQPRKRAPVKGQGK